MTFALLPFTFFSLTSLHFFFFFFQDLDRKMSVENAPLPQEYIDNYRSSLEAKFANEKEDQDNAFDEEEREDERVNLVEKKVI